MLIWVRMFRFMEFSVTCEKQKKLDERTETMVTWIKLIQDGRYSLFFYVSLANTKLSELNFDMSFYAH